MDIFDTGFDVGGGELSDHVGERRLEQGGGAEGERCYWGAGVWHVELCFHHGKASERWGMVMLLLYILYNARKRKKRGQLSVIMIRVLFGQLSRG